MSVLWSQWLFASKQGFPWSAVSKSTSLTRFENYGSGARSENTGYWLSEHAWSDWSPELGGHACGTPPLTIHSPLSPQRGAPTVNGNNREQLPSSQLHDLLCCNGGVRPACTQGYLCLSARLLTLETPCADNKQKGQLPRPASQYLHHGNTATV